jgi:hypothetical protein
MFAVFNSVYLCTHSPLENFTDNKYNFTYRFARAQKLVSRWKRETYVLRAFEKKLLKGIFGRQREEITGKSWTFINEELIICFLRNNTSVITWNSMRWAEHAHSWGRIERDRAFETLGGRIMQHCIAVGTAMDSSAGGYVEDGGTGEE